MEESMRAIFIPTNTWYPPGTDITEITEDDDHLYDLPFLFRTFLVRFFDDYVDVLVTSFADVASEWLDDVLSDVRMIYETRQLAVGVGVEYKRGGNKWRKSPATLHLSIGRQCLIFQLCQCDAVPESLRTFLLDENVHFVGIFEDIHRVRRNLLMFRYPNAERLEINGRFVNLKDMLFDKYERILETMESIVEEIVGHKGVNLENIFCGNNWEKQHLSYGQVLKACLSAYVPYRVAKMERVWGYIPQLIE